MDGVPGATASQVASDLIVQVKQMNGQVLEISAAKSKTILWLKEAIQERCDVLPCSQQLFFGTDRARDDVSLVAFCSSETSILEVSMVLSPMCGMLSELEAEGLTRDVKAEPASAVQDKLARLASHAGNGQLPTHVEEWFSLLLAKGVALSFLDPNLCLAHPERNSVGLLYISEENEMLHVGSECRTVHLLELAGEGSVLEYMDFDVEDEPCRTALQWQQQASPPKQVWASLSEYMTDKLGKSRDLRQKANEHERLSNSGRNLVIQCRTLSEGDQGIRTLTPEFGEFATSTVGELKQFVADALELAQGDLRMITAGKELANDRLLSDYAIHGGSTLHVVARR